MQNIKENKQIGVLSKDVSKVQMGYHYLNLSNKIKLIKNLKFILGSKCDVSI